MARMHARKRGRSGSTKPLVEGTPEWVDTDEEKITDIIGSLAKDGKTSSEIGIILRDQYGIPDAKQITGKKISDIMKELDMYPEMPEDILKLMAKAVNLRDHMEQNRKDLSNKRGLHLVEAKIRRLAKYYKKQGVISEDWKYSMDKAEMLVK